MSASQPPTQPESSSGGTLLSSSPLDRPGTRRKRRHAEVDDDSPPDVLSTDSAHPNDEIRRSAIPGRGPPPAPHRSSAPNNASSLPRSDSPVRSPTPPGRSPSNDSSDQRLRNFLGPVVAEIREHQEYLDKADVELSQMLRILLGFSLYRISHPRPSQQFDMTQPEMAEAEAMDTSPHGEDAQSIPVDEEEAGQLRRAMQESLRTTTRPHLQAEFSTPGASGSHT